MTTTTTTTLASTTTTTEVVTTTTTINPDAFITEWVHTTGNFTLPLRTGYTYNMMVDWGDGSALSEVTAFNDVDATHAYTAGTYQITITGTCGAFYMNNNSTNRGKLRKILQWGNMGFTGAGLQSAFHGCSNLNTLPEGRITGTSSIDAMFQTFRGCSSLVSIPPELFYDLTSLASAGFSNTFNGCTNIESIPSGLFDKNTLVSANGFVNTFYNCAKIAEIPAGLFDKNTALTTNAFNSTFYGTKVTEIPSGLFNNNPLVSGDTVFLSTFALCSLLTSIPSGLFDYNTNVTGFVSTFSLCTSLTDIPSNLFDIHVNAGFTNTFQGCSSLENVPNYLFRYNRISSNPSFSGTFQNCTKLKLNPYLFFSEEDKDTRFASATYIAFTNCFSRASFSGEKGIAPSLWNCTFGVAPIITGCFGGAGNNSSSVLNYCAIPETWGSNASACGILTELIVFDINSISKQLRIQISEESIPAGGTLTCYLSGTEDGIESPENIVLNSKAEDYFYEATLPVQEGMFYILVVYENGVDREDLTYSAFHYSVLQVATTIINIVAPNYTNTTNPDLPYLHGTIYYNEYFYGSARGAWNGLDVGGNLIKLKTDNYTDKTIIKFYQNKNGSTGVLGYLEQIVHCLGYLWCQSSGHIIRINPATLDYMVFTAISEASYGQPIGTDGIYLYVSTNVATHKINTSLLLGEFVDYGYTGDSMVPLPVGSVLGSCTVIQRHPSINAYVHSVQIDSRYVYLAVTTSSNFNGYDADLDIYIYHFQKIDKATMITVGDIVIPKSTDDMVQDTQYVYLAPEYSNTELDLYGAAWGLYAIRKTDLYIKYLKALHSDFNTVNEANRAAYGVQYFGQYILVQLVNSKKSIVIRTDEVDQWGAGFPVGGATEKIYTFQINGTPMSSPSNELVSDSSGVFHANTWEPNTIVYKFTETELEFNACPNVESYLIEHLVNSTTLGGFVLDTGGSAITETGFYYGKDPIAVAAVNNSGGTTTTTTLGGGEPVTQIISADTELSFSATLSLSPGLYFFKAYATNEVGECYGATVPFIVGNTVILDKDNDDAIVSLESVNSGHAVRCCKPAPGIADGVTGTVTDVHGNSYATIVINEIEWMAEDLIVTRYADTSIIPNLVDSLAWSADETGALSAYNNNWENSCIDGVQDAVTTTTTT